MPASTRAIDAVSTTGRDSVDFLSGLAQRRSQQLAREDARQEPLAPREILLGISDAARGCDIVEALRLFGIQAELDAGQQGFPVTIWLVLGDAHARKMRRFLLQLARAFDPTTIRLRIEHERQQSVRCAALRASHQATRQGRIHSWP